MALRIKLEEEALTGLRAGRAYYRHESRHLARRFGRYVREQLELIATQPEMGRDYDEVALRPGFAGMQWFPLRDFPYIVFWTNDDETMHVWLIEYAGRDLPKIITKHFGER